MTEKMVAPMSDTAQTGGTVEAKIRQRYATEADSAVKRQEQWDALTDAERHAITCYAPQFGKKCRHGRS